MKSHKCNKTQRNTETDSWVTSYFKPLTTVLFISPSNIPDIGCQPEWSFFLLPVNKIYTNSGHSNMF